MRNQGLAQRHRGTEEKRRILLLNLRSHGVHQVSWLTLNLHFSVSQYLCGENE